MMPLSARNVELNKLTESELVNSLQYHYQPQFCMNTLTVKAFECLLRLAHPCLGVASPAHVLPYMDDADLWPLAWPKLLNDIAVEQQRRAGILKLAINVAPRELEAGENSVFLNTFYGMAKAGQLSAHDIEIEITEEAQITDYDQVNASIFMLKHLGSTVVIDDFGAGYSNMSMLEKLDIDGVKIDRSLICGIETSITKQAIVKSIVDISKVKGCYTLAEGIETSKQLNVSRDLGCCYGQGFYLGRPSPHFIYKASF